METKAIHIGEALRFGWTTMRNNIGFFIGVLLVALLIGVVPGLVTSYLQAEDLHVASVVLHVLSLVLGTVITMGLIRISLSFCDEQRPSFGVLFSCFPLFFRYLVSWILYILIVVAGAILLVFPAVIWGIKFSLWPYFIVDRQTGPVEALRASSKATSGVKWDLLGFYFVVSAVQLLGILCLVIGLFAAWPTAMVATALVYRKLLSQTEGV